MKKNKTPKFQSTTLSTKVGFFVMALLTLCATLTYTSQKGWAQQDPGCDPEYFESLQSRAWLEAQREITQNQNLITKPDSVLEYTCFDLYLNELADHAQDMFSETQRWGQIRGIRTSGAGSTDDALEQVVGTALRTYVSQNFEEGGTNGPYDLLGGRLNGTDHEMTQAVSGNNAQYQCDIMRQVWQQAKCMNFIDNETHDGFYTFDEYRDYDPDHRFLPSECPHVQRWETDIRTATVDADTPWEEDDVETFLEQIDPDDCQQSGIVSTGFNVYRRGEHPEDWRVCIAPGCTYSIDSNQCS